MSVCAPVSIEMLSLQTNLTDETTECSNTVWQHCHRPCQCNIVHCASSVILVMFFLVLVVDIVF